MRASRSGSGGTPRMPSSWLASSWRSKRASAEPLDPTRALEFRQQRRKRMSPMELVRSVGGHEQDHGHRAQISGQEAEQFEGRTVGPVDVLEDDRNRASLTAVARGSATGARTGGPARSRRSRVGSLEPAAPSSGIRRASSARPEPAIASSSARSTVRRQAAQRLDHRAERQTLAPEREATTLQHAHTVADGETFDLTHEAGLADAGLTPDEDDTRMAPACLVQSRRDSVEFVSAADEGGARDAEAIGHCASRRPAPSRSI